MNIDLGQVVFATLKGLAIFGAVLVLLAWLGLLLETIVRFGESDFSPSRIRLAVVIIPSIILFFVACYIGGSMK